MGKKYLFLGTVFLVLLGVLSCGKEGDPLKDAYGYLKLDFSEDQADVVIRTKADEPVFAVDILNSAGVIVRSVKDHRELGAEPLKLKSGTYSVQATSGEQVDCAFEKPFYSGNVSVVVDGGSVQSCSVVCKLASSKVSVRMDPSMDQYFKEYIVMVKKEEGSNGLIYSSTGNTIHQAGYFIPGGSLNWSLYVVNHNNIVFDGEVKGVIPNIKPKEHYILNFKLSEGEGEGGAANVTIVVDDSVNDKEQDFVIDLNKKEKPNYAGEGFNLAESQLIPEQTALPWKVQVDAKAGFSKMRLSHNSLACSNAGIPYSFDLLSVSPAEKAAIRAAGITWDEIREGALGVSIDFSGILSRLPLGPYQFKLSAWDRQNQAVDAVFQGEIIPGVETTALSVEPWAKRAFFYGVWNTLTKPEGVGMEYKKVGATEWIQITGGFTEDGKKFSVEVKGLEPNTAYLMRTFSAKEISNEIRFTTEQAEQIENMLFDKWYKDGKNWYANENASNFWWDSGNKGANTLSEVNPTAPTPEVAVAGVGKQAAKLESKAVFGVLAAGSIYLGQFSKTIGTTGAEIYFGRRYTGRPLAMKGYYNYIPKTIDKVKEPYNHLAGQTDYCQIYCVLTDWTDWFTVNTSTGKFVDIANDPHIIAYGEMTKNENSNGYQEFNIPLVYRNKRIPTHCVIVASSSKFGDFFTGAVGSVLYIDEFEFTF